MSQSGELSGGPVVRILHFHCRGHGFNPWLGNQDPACCIAQKRKKNEIKFKIQLFSHTSHISSSHVWLMATMLNSQVPYISAHIWAQYHAPPSWNAPYYQVTLYLASPIHTQSSELFIQHRLM